MRAPLIVLAVLAAAVLTPPPLALAISAIPDPVVTTQPDGTELTVRLFGDEWYHFYETADGHAIVQTEDHWWVYADLDASGRYVPTPLRVGKDDPGTENHLNRVGPHLREDAEHRTEARRRFVDETIPGILEKAAELAEGLRLTTINVPVVLVQYPDFFASQSASSFDDMMNQPGYGGTGSFRDYFEENSYSNLTVTATVYGWYTALNNRTYYRDGSGTISERNRSKELVRRGVDQAEAGGANWSAFDNDLDGNVDIVFAVHQGRGAECGDPDLIWSHHWYLQSGGVNLAVNYDGVRIDRYIVMPEISCGSGHIEIGVFCHEFGHALGLPDLYDIDGTSWGIGRWGLMGLGGWGGSLTGSPARPTHLSAWSKIEQGWVTPTVVASNQVGASIPAVEITPQVYKLWTNGTPAQEYFLVENRQRTGFDADLPTGGLAIWHVDETRRRTDNTDNADETHKLLDVEEADGLDELDGLLSAGDAGDVFPGSTGNQSFNGGTTPGSDDYALAPTEVCVDNISTSGATMTADFCVTAAGTPDLVIRDCAADVGAEPDVACAANWVRSPDIYVDNNDDGIIDAPVQGVVNHLYVRAWNIGAATTNARIKCWYVNPSLGLRFGLGSPGTPIVDHQTGQSELTIASVGTLNPTPGGQGYRRYFNWLIPTPPPSIDHYCIGCVIENATDPQTSAVPLEENNLGQINYWALALKAGTTPARFGDPDSMVTVFRQEVRVVNPLEEPAPFLVLVEGLDPEYEVVPGREVELFLEPGQEEVITFDLIHPQAEHADSARVEFALFRMPEFERLGGLVNDLYIDDLPPERVPGWSVEYFRPGGDSYPRPTPTHELTWFEPAADIGGFVERVRCYDVYVSTDPAELDPPGEGVEPIRFAGDDNPQKDGRQFYYYAQDQETYYFTVVPIDLAGNAGEHAVVMTAELPPLGIGEGTGAAVYPLRSRVHPNPVRGLASIRYVLPASGPVRLSIYDVSGRERMTLVEEHQEAGEHRAGWQATSLPSGVYFYRIEAGQLTETRRFTVIR
jgi:immune inhibitor A